MRMAVSKLRQSRVNPNGSSCVEIRLYVQIDQKTRLLLDITKDSHSFFFVFCILYLVFPREAYTVFSSLGARGENLRALHTFLIFFIEDKKIRKFFGIKLFFLSKIKKKTGHANPEGALIEGSNDPSY